jgi:hypothetical protein
MLHWASLLQTTAIYTFFLLKWFQGAISPSFTLSVTSFCSNTILFIFTCLVLIKFCFHLCFPIPSGQTFVFWKHHSRWSRFDADTYHANVKKKQLLLSQLNGELKLVLLGLLSSGWKQYKGIFRNYKEAIEHLPAEICRGGIGSRAPADYTQKNPMYTP